MNAWKGKKNPIKIDDRDLKLPPPIQKKPEKSEVKPERTRKK
jgi:hypothetical protein